MAIQGAVGDGQSVTPAKLTFGSTGSVDIADPEVLFLGDYSRHGNDLFIEHGGKAVVVEDYFAAGGGNLVAPSGAFLTPSVVQALAGPLAPGQYAQAGGGAATALVEIGKVVSLEGTATATHSDGVTVNLANGDPVYQGDVVQTGAASKLGVSFIDDSVFSMSADARMLLNELIFDPAKVEDSSMVVNLVQGSFVFVTGQVAPSGDMQVQTPVATMGIRGTTPLVNINTLLGVTEFSILPDPGSGKVGSYVLLDKTTGALLATVASVGDKWVVNSLSDEVVRVAKSVLELQDDQNAIGEIRDAVASALGRRTELNGSNSYQNAADDSSGQDDVLDNPLGADTTSSSGSGSGLSSIAEFANTFDEGFYEPIVADRPSTSIAYVSPSAQDDSFTANDGEVLGGNVINGSGGGPDQGTTLTVTEVNDQPLTFVGDTASVLLPANADQQTEGALLVIGRSGGIVYDPSSAFQYLGVGEQRVDSFTYTVSDGSSESVATVNITVDGRNDAPEILDGPVSAVVAETDAALAGDPLTGTLAFTDVDISDTGHTYRVVGVVETMIGGAPPNPMGAEALLSLLDMSGSNDSGALGTDGEIVWTFTGDEAEFDYLSDGESVRLTYTVEVTDPYGATDTQTVTITIVGASEGGPNATPVISIDTSGPVPDTADAALAETNAGLSTSGTLTVTDADLGDAVTASVQSVAASGTTTGLVADNAALLAMVSVTAGSIAADPNDAKNLGWTFDSGSQAFDYLSAGESLTLTYTVRATDGASAYDDQTLTITITGTNDAPIVSAGDVTGAVSELGTAVGTLTNSGAISFTDVDLADVHLVSATGTPVGATLGTLTAVKDTDTTGTGTGGQLTWTYAVAASAVEYLAAGETKVESFTLSLDYQHGGVVTRTVNVTITGTNDAPAIGVLIFDSASDTLAETDTGLATSGTLTVTDVDLADAVTASVHSVSATGTTTGLGANNAALLDMFEVSAGSIAADSDDGNNLIWTFNSGSQAFDYLGDGESLTLTYTVRATDGSAAHDDQAVTIIITGTNDAPEISAAVGEDAGTVVENGETFTSGSLIFADPDRTDTPAVSGVTAAFAAEDAYGETFALSGDQQAAFEAAFNAAVGSGSTNTGVIDWDFDLDGVDLSFLGQDETVTAVFTVTVDDGHGGTDTHDITITINGANDGDRDDVLYGTANDDTMFGGLGNDTLYGLAANDLLIGGDGDDTLVGGEGDDYMAGGKGADTYDGGGDSPEEDGISFRDEDGVLGVVVNLAAGTATDTYGNAETLTGIEDVDGSENGDTLTGNAADNFFSGRDGADHYDGGEGSDQVSFQNETGAQGAVVNLETGIGTDTYGNSETFAGIEVLRGSQHGDNFTGDANDNSFRGLAGDDTMDGGEGWDQVRYDRDANNGGLLGVTVDLASHTATDGFGNTDTLFNIENVMGSQFDDVLTGDDEDNELIGLDGDDTLNGGGGRDYLEGGDGDDTLNGGEGNDYLAGGEGQDTYDGGGEGPAQYDTISFRNETGALGVTVNLALGTATDTYGNSETLSRIEEVDGSGNDDEIIGDAGDNYIRGFAGNDEIDGGAGWDIVSYNEDEERGATSGVTVNLASGHATDGFGDSDHLTGIEGVHGSSFGDTLTGNGGDNDFIGYAGDDTINGGGGRDTVRYDQDVDRGGNNGVVVDLAAHTATDGFGDTDSLFSIERVHGTQFDDEITGDGQDNDLIGLGGADVLRGDGGDDYLEGGEGDDQLVGGQGDDYLAGGEGTDTYDGGGSGSDQFDTIGFSDETGDGDVIVNLETGYVRDTYGNEEVATGIEEVDGSNNNDTITGNDEDNSFRGNGGEDSYEGGSGFDQVTYDNETGGLGVFVNLSEGQGTDTYGNAETFAGIESVRGSQWADTLIGDGNSYNSFRGMAGNDFIDGGVGEGWAEVRYDRDVNRGGNSGVTVNLAEGYAIDGFGDTDTLVNIDGVVGSQFDDVLTGDDEDNQLIGMGGDDILDGRGGEGEGGDWDTAAYWNADSGIVVDLHRGSRQVVRDGEGGTDTLIDIEQVSGSKHDDTMIGGWENDSFYGDGGEDLLIGGAGDDWLNGGDGDDRIDGGGGYDGMSGGSGADTFFMAPGTGQDRIEDFNLAEGDLIDLQAYGFASVEDFYSVTYYDYGYGYYYTYIDFNGTDGLTLAGVDLTALPDQNVAFVFSGALNLVQGTDGDDPLSGTSGNDLIVPGGSTPNGGDEIYASRGSDTINFAGAEVGGGYYSVDYSAIDQYTDLTVTIDGATGTVLKSGIGADTLSNLDMINGEDGGFGIYAGGGNDLFTVDTSSFEYFELAPGSGQDALDVSGTGFVNVSFWSYNNVVIDANLTIGTAQEINGSSTLDVTGFVNQWRGTVGNDSFTGNGGNERFITVGGQNTVDGGGGFDTVRYDRNEVSNLSIVFSGQGAAIVSGLWEGQAFADTLTNIEDVRGARTGVTQFVGSAGDERFDIRGGINFFEGGGGNDTIVHFEIGRDRIDLSPYGFNDAGDIAGVSFFDDGVGNAYTTIDLNGTDTITVVGVDLTQGGVDLAEVFIFNGDPGTTANDLLAGTADDDVLRSGGQSLDDTGADQLDGGAGDDFLVAEGGFVNMVGGQGNDAFLVVNVDGYWDSARVDYSTSPDRIIANLSAAEFMGVAAMHIADGYGTTDTVSGIHGILDSAGDDYVRVDGSYRNAGGSAGFDVRLTGGDDTVDFTGAEPGVRVNYRAAADGVIVNLADGTATDADLLNGDDIGSDTLIHVNNVRGSDFNDTLIGNDSANRLRGQGGDDLIDGAGGYDRAEYSNSNAGIVVDMNLVSGQVIDDGLGGSDTLTDIEIIAGSQYADTMTANGEDTEFWGDLGDDTLYGGAGWDTLIGDFGDEGGLLGGNDQLFGGDGYDHLVGGSGDDRLEGGNDSDILEGGDGYDEFVFHYGETGVDQILDFATDNNAIILQGFGYYATDEIELVEDGFGGSNLMVGEQQVAWLQDYSSPISVDYDSLVDQHVITMYSV